MKRNLIFTMAAIAVLASCSKVETTYTGETPNAIGFRTNLSPMTKTYSPLADNISLGVYAQVKGGEKYFDNTEFKNVQGTWTAVPAKLYPKAGELEFTVYAPFDSQNMVISNGNISYPVAQQNDFLYGEQVYTGAKNSTELTVNLKHAKSMVRFNVKSNAEGVYKITKIVLTDVVKTGRVNVTFNPTHAKWTADAVSDLVIEEYLDAGNTVQQYGKDMMIIPSDTDKAVLRNKGKIQVHYTMYGEPQTPFEKQLTDDWVAGRRYIFNISFQDSVITFNPQVEDWVDEEFNYDLSE